MFRSLRFRMAASHAAVLAVILVTLGGILQLFLARSLDTSATNELEAAAQGQVERIREAGRAVAPVDSDVPSAAAVQLGVFVPPSGNPIGEPAEIPSWLRRYRATTTDLRISGERVRVVTLPATVDGRVIAWVSAGRSLEADDLLLHRVRLSLLVGGLIAVLASLAAGWWLAGRAVRPVERAYESQAGFAADASHELRTPLTFIRSGVEVLAERDPVLGAQVLSEVDYLTGLTRRLLALARAEAAGVAFDRSPVDVEEACREAARRSVGASGTALDVAGESGLIATGDRVVLEAALDAVLENVAVHGGGAAEIRWRADDGTAVISVADHGPGIPRELEDRAFERFFRADPSRARDTGGAGLGLALARTLVTAQGGRMWIEPTPAGGLTAKIGMPLRRPS
jgi:signal transduction histidine kinase